MKKVLLTLCAVLMAVPAFAVEVYSNGDTSVGIYGHIRGYTGYGYMTEYASQDGITTTGYPTELNNMFMGLQGNTRVGTTIKLGNVTAQFEIGANEKTMVNSTTSGTIGFRQAWAAYNFRNGSRLLVGKTDTPTVMNFISSVYDTDNGLNGFGGSPTGFRRFQIQYSIGGLTLALIEDDVNSGSALTTVTGFTDNAPYTPRAGIAYEYKAESLIAKIAATYTAINGSYTNAAGVLDWTNLHAFGIVLGVKPTFGNMWVSVHARYGMNEDLYGEGGTYASTGSFSHAAYTSLAGVNTTATLDQTKLDGSFNNIHRVGAAVEFGMKIADPFTFIVGAGYQATLPELEATAGVTQSAAIHSYAVFLQGQYAFNQHFALVPELAWFSTNENYTSAEAGVETRQNAYKNGLLLGVQFRASF